MLHTRIFFNIDLDFLVRLTRLNANPWAMYRMEYKLFITNNNYIITYVLMACKCSSEALCRDGSSNKNSSLHGSRTMRTQ